MNLHELDTYKLSDAVKFHNRLNPKLWGRDEKLLPEVRSKLLEIAADFQEFLGISDLEVKDITLSGSNAAYSYTPHSDIDLHLVVEQPQQNDEVYQELFNAKKYQYNDLHDIRIRGADVELYVQPANEPAVSLGEYSVLNDQWIEIPKRKRAQIDQTLVRHKYEDLQNRIQAALKENDSDRVQALINKIKAMRQSGLDQHGEFGPENLAFKMLRKQGWIKRLYDHVADAKDRELSLREQEPKTPFKYGFGSGPAVDDASDYRAFFKPVQPKEPAVTDLQFKTAQDYEWFKKQQQKKKELASEDASSTWDGVNPTTCMFLNEVEADPEPVVHEFIKSVADQLGIEKLPTIKMHTDPEWSVAAHSFGRYDPDSHTLNVSLANRHLLDILRTVAHELTHCRQNQDQTLPDDAGATGSGWENQANAQAGVFMRDFAAAHPEYFESQPLGESASGYIPTKKQARDPRYSMALTVDIKPGQVGREANKMKLDTDSQGRPAMIYQSVNQLHESLAAEFAAFSEAKSYGYGSTPLSQVPGEREDELGNQEATGPEFPPQMPAGTTKIDVSDLTDWYRLGMDISDLDDAKPEDYNQGPPQTVMVFPSDEAEQGYLKQFKRLGLKTHDMDPDVAGGEDIYGKHLHQELAEEFEQLEEEFLGEIKMSPSNLRAEAAKTGAQAGMEFEMIVPNAGDVDNEPEYEPDYDQDQRSRSFSDIEEFFYDGDYNGRRDVANLIAEMQEQFVEWQDEQILNSWDNEGFELLKEYIKDNGYFDDDEAQEEATNALQAEYGDDITPEDFEKMLDALISEKFDEFVQDQWDNQGQFYDEAREQYIDEQRGEHDEREWLDEHYPYMTDVQNNFDISWPYYYDTNEGEEADIDAIADDFSNSVGKPVNASRNYHGARREPGHYVVEPDGSLEGDNDGDAGLEFVSPPMPIDEMMSDLNKVKAWADREGCYTNRSTGLHINISVPNYSLEKLDYVKLALLLGDKYVLEQFGRAGNTYCKAAIGKVRDKVRQSPDTAKTMLDKMRNGMEQLASKAIHSGITDKYTSINTKSGYIEFRSPGGDWLNENFDKIENTLLRFTVALSAAMDPEAYRQEYLKKLYKLLNPEGLKDEYGDMIEEFSRYMTTLQGSDKEVSGQLSKETQQAIKDFRKVAGQELKQNNLATRIKKGKAPGGQRYWWRVGLKSNPNYQIEVVGSSAAEAIDAAMDANPELMRYNRNTDFTTRPIRPYSDAPVKATVGEPQAIGQRSGPTVGGRPSNPAGRWVITPEADRRSVVYRFNAAGFDDANVVRRQWAQENPGVWIVQRDDNQTLGQPAGSSRNALSQADIENRLGWPDQTGDANYEVVDRRTQQPVFKFVANTDQDAQRKYSQYLDVMGMPEDTEDYGFREIVVPGSTVDLQRQRAAHNRVAVDNLFGEFNDEGPGQQYKIIRMSDRSLLTVVRASSQQEAEAKAAQVFRFNGLDPDLYDVFPVSGEGYEVVPQPPGRGSEIIPGMWDILIDGQQVFRVPAATQAEANQSARQWLSQRSPEFNREHQGGEVEVVPARREA